ncbi:MAG: nitrite reductase/ring-hydroxylating ferredoxin subunit [Cyclobacteriaceae bacterium]|jgi:nitrite reductase/ring-hydroxylating ferredoxin subunit
MEEEILLLDSGTDAKKLFPEGKIRQFKIGVRRVAVILAKDRFIAFDNQCPHSGYPLDEGHINFENELICPLHSYVFNLDTGEETSSRCKNLHFYQVKLNKNGDLMLYIN